MTEKRPPGRPTKFTPEVRKVIIEAVGLLAPYATAAEAAGVSYDALNEWMNRGQAELEGEFRQFFQDIKKAEAQGILARLALIKKAADSGQWQAGAWTLERRWPEEYGRRIQADVRGNVKVVVASVKGVEIEDI